MPDSYFKIKVSMDTLRDALGEKVDEAFAEAARYGAPGSLDFVSGYLWWPLDERLKRVSLTDYDCALLMDALDESAHENTGDEDRFRELRELLRVRSTA